MEVASNGHHVSNGHGDHDRRRETSEERRVRKEKEKKAKASETDEERRIRKEKEKLNSSGKHKETEEERRIRKEKEKQNGGGEKKKETEEERRIRKEKERGGGGKKEETEEERRIRKNKERGETEEERRVRKDKERAAKENGGEKRKETEEERRIRKEKEKNGGEKRKETEEERRIRKEKEKSGGGHKKESEEERRIRKEKEKNGGHKKESEEERAARKERERKEKKEKNGVKEEVKEEVELDDDFFAAEEAKLNNSKHRKEESEQEAEEEQEEADEVKEEAADDSYDDTKQGITMQPMEDSDDDTPLARRKKPAVKRKVESGDESDDEPLSKKKEKQRAMKREPSYDDYEDEEDDYQRPSKKMKKAPAKRGGGGGVKKEADGSPTKKMTKKEQAMEDEKKVWKWWEEDNQLPEGVKWRFLEHKGPWFAPPYEPLPAEVRFWYDGKTMRLTEETEECATFYGRMLDHDYTTKECFNKNFFKDWRKTMSEKEKEIIRDLSKCDFSEIDAHFKKTSEERKNRSKEEKNVEKEKNAALVEEFGFCMMDGHRERIGNFRTEPPSLFRGRGEHPKQGMIKRRIHPEDVIINCSKDSKVPPPPDGHKWKKVQHDNSVTWLASWTENIQGQIKYVMLNPSSRLKGEKDWQKYETARRLKGEIGMIRDNYMSDMKSKEMRVRQRAVAMYFIDKLALRAGNEKDGDEQADTVGCCSLRVEHIELHETKDGKEWVVEMDFLGKDSIRYNNDVAVDKRVYKNVKLFMESKKDGDDLFDRLNTSVLNQYLTSLMDGLTAKVFRTYNASYTLQCQLDELTDKDDNTAAKMLSYNRANRAVAVLCNHQRAVPKTFDKSMEAMDGKLEAKHEAIKDAEKKLKHAKKACKNSGGSKTEVDKCKKTVERLLEQLEKLEIAKTDRDENKTIALGTSKLNYLDPRISVQWCKTHDVPIEKVYTKTHREKFRWAIDMIQGNDDDVFHF